MVLNSVAGLCLVALILCVTHLSKALDPIKPQFLYKNFFQENPACEKRDFDLKCWKTKYQRDDYMCRYGRFNRRTRRITIPKDCYCCGEIYTYIEHEDFCNHYCREESDCVERNEFGCCTNILTLPLNFGDPPESILCNGAEREPETFPDYIYDMFEEGGSNRPTSKPESTSEKSKPKQDNTVHFAKPENPNRADSQTTTTTRGSVWL